MILNPVALRQSIVEHAHRQLAWPPPVSQPLFRADPETTTALRHTATDLKLAVRLAAVTLLIAAGIGLGHGGSVSASSTSSSLSSEAAASADRVTAVDAISTAVNRGR
jgi:hypothetical protein